MDQIEWTSMEEAWLSPQTSRQMDAFLARQTKLIEKNCAVRAFLEEGYRRRIEFNVRAGVCR